MECTSSENYTEFCNILNTLRLESPRATEQLIQQLRDFRKSLEELWKMAHHPEPGSFEKKVLENYTKYRAIEICFQENGGDSGKEDWQRLKYNFSSLPTFQHFMESTMQNVTT